MAVVNGDGSVTYTSQIAITTLPLRKAAYDMLAMACIHFHNFNLNLVSIVVRPDHFVDITLSGPMPPEQIPHLGLS